MGAIPEADPDEPMETKPFKFVTVYLQLAMTLASPSRTRPSTAGRTTLTTTSVSTPRARISVHAASSTTLTAPCAPRPGLTDGITNARLETSLLVWSR
ncbi:Cytochrome c oxidase subunit 6B [Aspergillus fumigatus]